MTGSTATGSAHFYVAMNGSDSAAGTIGAPFASIEHAVANAKPGDTVYVRGGVYKGAIDIWNGGTDGAPLHIKAYPGERVIIDGSGTAPDTDLVVISAPHVIFEGFEVTNATRTGVVLWSTHHVQVLNNVIHDTELGGFWAGSDRLGVSSNHLIEGNIIFNTALMNKERALNEGWPIALAVGATSDTVVRDNIVFKNYGEGIGAGSSTHIRLTDNVVYDNFSVQMYFDNTQDITATGNTLFETGDAEYYRGGKPGSGILIANERTAFEMPTTRIFVDGNTYGGVETARYDGSYGWGGGMTNSTIGSETVLGREAVLARAVEVFREGAPSWWAVGDNGTLSAGVSGTPVAPRSPTAPSPILSDKDGASTLVGTAGNDTFTVSSSTTKVLAGQGVDVVQASVSWVMSDGVEMLQLTGLDAINGTGTNADDLLAGNMASNVIHGLGGDDRLNGNGGSDTLHGGLGNDTLTGGDGNDVLRGGDGDDLLDGNAGSDLLDGGWGNDTYIVGDATDTIVEATNGGTDLVKSSVTATLAVNVENLVLSGSGAINGTGNSLANTVTGNDANNVLTGGGGRDTLLGAGGVDKLIGGAVRDILDGGAGADTLTGGKGNDVFRFANVAEAGDVITDFGNRNGNNDTFQISASGFGGGLVAGALSADQFQVRADNIAQDSNDRFLYRTTDQTLWFDNNGNADGGLTMVADLDIAKITSADILIY